MTSVYSAEGKNIPCTVIEAGPCVVTQIRTVEKDSYEAVQIAYDDKSEKHTTGSLLGHFKKAGTTPKRKMAEFKENGLDCKDATEHFWIRKKPNTIQEKIWLEESVAHLGVRLVWIDEWNQTGKVLKRMLGL